ncbi:MAG: response regulator, partial [Alphaproteobacteria bacterium]|nr:response regulator [Alphaproteobacteria bacterium]
MPSGGISSRASILLADDDASICTVLEQAIAQQGYDVRVTREGRALWGWVEQGAGDLVITDVMMPDADGLELLKKIKSVRPTLPVIVISARRTLLTAVRAAEFGAFEFLAKPFDLDELMKLIRHSLEVAEGSAPRQDVHAEAMPFIGDSPAMQELYRGVARLTSVDLTVLIEGESGTGKELIARALHDYGPRKQKAFVA